MEKTYSLIQYLMEQVRNEEFRIRNTTATKKIFALKKRIRAVCGGTAASKTISILIWCIDYAQSTKNELISVVSESYPHLSGGAMRDFEIIMKDRGYWKDTRWVKNPRTIYTFETGSQIEFVSVDTYEKAHGPRRDILFLNEANNIPYPIVDQLITRTRKIIWMDWNPVEDFWFDEKMLGQRDDIDFITLTYLDNEAIDEGTLSEIMAHRNDSNWWKVYALGQKGELETRIYKGWAIIDEVPHEARLERHWLDFGFTNDPTAIGDLYYYNGGYILDEQLYQKGLSNKQIADFLLNLKKALTVADSAEPKSIAEISSYGVQIIGANKKNAGREASYNKWAIGVVQDQQISVTKRSINILKEYRNYLWITDKDGKITNEPMDLWNHHMDGVKYVITSLAPALRRRELLDTMPYYVRGQHTRKNPAR